MIERVSFERVTYAPAPARFEAGTPPVAEAIGLGAALEWLMALDHSALESHEQDLLAYATARLGEMKGVTLHGTAAGKVSVLSFSVEGIHPHDVGTVLDKHGVAVRAGHHCAQPLMHHLGVGATVRASFGVYNTRAEVDLLVRGVGAAQRMFG
jgi:cysteine desulfurase/selenocysteine lyase